MPVSYDGELGDANVGEKCRDPDVLLMTPGIQIDLVPFLVRCQLISVAGTVMDAIPVPAATATGTAVLNVPAFSTEAVAGHALARLLEATRRIPFGQEMYATEDGAPDLPMKSAVATVLDISLRNIEASLDGHLRNVVNPDWRLRSVLSRPEP